MVGGLVWMLGDPCEALPGHWLPALLLPPRQHVILGVAAPVELGPSGSPAEGGQFRSAAATKTTTGAVVARNVRLAFVLTTVFLTIRQLRDMINFS
jgi:hypothetical protein